MFLSNYTDKTGNQVWSHRINLASASAGPEIATNYQPLLLLWLEINPKFDTANPDGLKYLHHRDEHRKHWL